MSAERADPNKSETQYSELSLTTTVMNPNVNPDLNCEALTAAHDDDATTNDEHLFVLSVHSVSPCAADTFRNLPQRLALASLEAKSYGAIDVQVDVPTYPLLS